MNKLPLNTAEAESIRSILQSIETETSGKAVIHVDEYCKGDAYFKATKIFQEMSLLEHPAKNSALIYIALKDRKLAVVADHVLNNLIGDDFIQNQCEGLAEAISQNNIKSGLETLLLNLKEVWKEHFPVIQSSN
jgi:uncharacterized membrane protein